jgi:endoglycosylceramidase
MRTIGAVASLAIAGCFFALPVSAVSAAGSAGVGPASRTDRSVERSVEPAGHLAGGTVHRSVQRLQRRGPFLTDPAGRVVILHGINLVDKRKPFIAPNSKRGFTARDARFMARHGINGVRLGVLFQGVMPRPGHIDHRYLNRVNRIVQLLAARHIWVLLDFHQDAFNQKFAGEGFPAWAVHDDGLPFVNLGSFFVNDQTPAVEQAYDHLWNDDDHLWHYYDQAWKAVAKRWRNQPYLMGYDLINEPDAGSQMATCANPAGCPVFDKTLQRFQNAAREAIRSVDKHNIVWYEPQFLFNAISGSNFTHVNDPEVGLDWHDYACTPAFVSGGVIPGDPDCKVNEPRVMNNAAKQAKVIGAASLMSEFGASDDLSDLARLTNDADQHLDGWMYWAYKTFNDPTGSPQEGLFRNDAKRSSVKQAKVKTLFHPYPQAIAGIPTAMSWDAAHRVLTFSYRPTHASKPTVVEIQPGFYPKGYRVRVRGGRVVSATHHRIHLRSGRHSRSVTVTVKPRG